MWSYISRGYCRNDCEWNKWVVVLAMSDVAITGTLFIEQEILLFDINPFAI